MNDEIKITATLKQVEYSKLKFPCFCVPTWEQPGRPKKYRWEHAGMVDSVIRGAADYFEIIDPKQIESL